MISHEGSELRRVAAAARLVEIDTALASEPDGDRRTVLLDQRAELLRDHADVLASQHRGAA